MTKWPSRRTVLGYIGGILAAPEVLRAQSRVLPKEVTVTSVSWIDAAGLPKLNFLGAVGQGLWAGLFGYWPFRVMVGLTLTSNPRPAADLPADFRSAMQFRALVQYRIGRDGSISDGVLDPGYTPPTDASKVPSSISWKMPADPEFHPGESSALSRIVTGQPHPASTLSVPSGYRFLAGGLIKFRAGQHTNDLGIKEALSPYHVPWVWCEHALVERGGVLKLIANGSRFPSHAWYVDGKRVGEIMQATVKMSDAEPALVTGRRAALTRLKAEDDNAAGLITAHPYTVAPRNDIQKIFDVSI